MKLKKIDINNWKRKLPYENFIKYTNPVFSLSTRLDVSGLCERCKRLKTSFFVDFLFIVMKCLNSIEEFRLRIVDGEVVIYDKIHPSYIVLNNNNVIVSCRTQMCDTYSVFYKNARADIAAAKRGEEQHKGFNSASENDCFYISSMRWVDFTSVLNPYDLNDIDSSSIPRITWGKFVDENGRKKMLMDISAHHALIDGEPVCRGFIKIQNVLENLENFFGNKD